MITFYLLWIFNIKSTHRYMVVNNVLDQHAMRILHGLYVISSSHHRDVLIFVLKLEITVGPYIKNFIF